MCHFVHEVLHHMSVYTYRIFSFRRPGVYFYSRRNQVTDPTFIRDRPLAKITYVYDIHFQCTIQCSMAVCREYHTYELASTVRGHHVYKTVWSPELDEVLEL